jgi:hypothetical protein
MGADVSFSQLASVHKDKNFREVGTAISAGAFHCHGATKRKADGPRRR